MSYRLYFDITTGLAADLVVPKGTLASIWFHVEFMERHCGLKRVPAYVPEGEESKGLWRWSNAVADMVAQAGEKTSTTEPQWWLRDREREARISDIHAAVFNGHESFIEQLYENLGKWAKDGLPVGQETEVLTAEESLQWMPAMVRLHWPSELMTRDVYMEYMRHVGEVLCGRESRGIQLDCEPLTLRQKAALLTFIESETDVGGYDLRAAFPLDEDLEDGYDVAFSYDGGYDWCSKCGPIHSDAFFRRCAVCPHQEAGECELRNEHPAEFEDEEEGGVA